MSTIAVGRMRIESGLAQARYHTAARKHSTAPVETVWALLADVSTWADWGPWDSASLVAPGVDERLGVGAVRRLRRGRIVSLEKVEGFQPPWRLQYALTSGLPLHNYRAEVLLRSLDSGTQITWHAAYDRAPRGTAGLSRLVLARFLAKVAKDLAQAAEQHA